MSNSPWAGRGAAWLLMRLQWRARIRGWLRAVRRPRNLLLVLIVGALMVAVVWARSLDGGGGGQRLGVSGEITVPVLVSFFLMLSVVGSTSNGALQFTPAEAQFLLPGPLGTRALVCMQTFDSLIKSSLAAIFFAVFLTPAGVGFLRGVLGYVLLFAVMSFLSTAVDLAQARVPRTRRRRRARRMGFALFAGTVTVIALTAWFEGPWPSGRSDVEDGATTWLAADALRHLGWPARPLLGLLRPDALSRGLLDHALALLATGWLFAFQLRRSSGVREAAAETSAHVAQVVEKARAGKLHADTRKQTSGRVLPMLPRWGGAGPHIWRQLSILVRQRKTYLTLAVTALVVGGINLFITEGELAAAAAIVLGWLAFMGPFYVQCDFRSDYECLAWLRSLPCRPTALAAGQVLASALVLTLIEYVLAGWVVFLPDLPRRSLWLVFLAAMPCVNVVQMAMENAVWLMFPSRPSTTQGTPGVFQVGRMYTLFAVKFVVLLVMAVPWALGFWVGGAWGALAAGVPTGAFVCVFSVKALGWAFMRADPPAGAAN